MQIHRLVNMIYLLLDHQSLTAKELAQRFEVSTRTIYRDVETLAQAGIPIYTERGKSGGIRLMEQFVLGKSMLTEKERQSVLQALQGLQAVGYSQSQTALEKLSAIFGDVQENWVSVDYGSWHGQDAINERFEILRRAIFERQLVAFDYYADGQNATYRTVESLKLICRGHDWYLLAWCRLRADYRYFKLSRMIGLQLLAEHFTKRALPQAKFQEATAQFFATPMLAVTVRVQPKAVHRLMDDFCPLKLKTLADGRLETVITLPQEAWLYSYLATYGAMLEVVAPKDVRTNLHNWLKDAQKQYEI